MSLMVIAITVGGFAKSYYLGSYFHAPALPLTTRIHGAAFTAWVIFFLAQTMLVASHRTDVHRKLGWIGAALAAFMCVIAIKTAIMAVHAAVVCCNAELARGFLIVPVSDVIVFGILVGCAVAYRRDAIAHKRLMLLATLAILDAATGRWPLRIIQSGAWPYAYGHPRRHHPRRGCLRHCRPPAARARLRVRRSADRRRTRGARGHQVDACMESVREHLRRMTM